MKQLLTILLLGLGLGSYAQQGMLRIPYDSIMVVSKIKLPNLAVGTMSDSLVTKKTNGNLARLAMNQLMIPVGNITGLTTDNVIEGLTNKYDKTVTITGLNGLTASGTYPTFSITRKKQETFTGTTAGSGTYTVVYGTAYSVEPNVMISQRGGTPTNTLVLTSSSTTGFTITANNRIEVLGLLPTYPTLNGAVVNVVVTEK